MLADVNGIEADSDDDSGNDDAEYVDDEESVIRRSTFDEVDKSVMDTVDCGGDSNDDMLLLLLISSCSWPDLVDGLLLLVISDGEKVERLSSAVELIEFGVVIDSNDDRGDDDAIVE